MKNPVFSKYEAVRFGWQTAINNLPFLIGVLIIGWAVMMSPSFLSSFVPKENVLFKIFFMLVNFVIQGIITLGFTKISLDLCDQKKPDFSDLFSQHKLIVSYLIAAVVYGTVVFMTAVLLIVFSVFLHHGLLINFYHPFWYGAIIFTGILVLTIIPVVILAIKFSFYTYLIVDRNLGPIQALEKSWIITAGVKWDLFFFGVLLTGIQILGLLCLGIGLLVSVPVSMMASAFVYRKLSERLGVPVLAN